LTEIEKKEASHAAEIVRKRFIKKGVFLKKLKRLEIHLADLAAKTFIKKLEDEIPGAVQVFGADEENPNAPGKLVFIREDIIEMLLSGALKCTRYVISLYLCTKILKSREYEFNVSIDGKKHRVKEVEGKPGEITIIV